MQFQLLPVLHTTLALYRQPRGIDRFGAYLKVLQGDTKGDLALPIGGFNPMAKDHLLQKLEALEALDIEPIMAEVLAQLAEAPELQMPSSTPMQVAFNLADDVGGGWTNRYTADYDNRFKIGALVKRGFITPLFWAGEEISKALIRSRTAAACFRTAYWLQHRRPKTLREHLAQEAFAAYDGSDAGRLSAIATSLGKEQASCTEPSFIFGALYGDAASQALGYRTHGFAVGALND